MPYRFEPGISVQEIVSMDDDDLNRRIADWDVNLKDPHAYINRPEGATARVNYGALKQEQEYRRRQALLLANEDLTKLTDNQLTGEIARERADGRKTIWTNKRLIALQTERNRRDARKGAVQKILRGVELALDEIQNVDKYHVAVRVGDRIGGRTIVIFR